MKRFVKIIDVAVSDLQGKWRAGIMFRLAQKSYASPPHEILSVMALYLILQPTTQDSSFKLPMK